MEERDFFEERAEMKTHELVCPHCNQTGEYQINWLVRRKKQQCPRGADETDRMRYQNARSYMVRRDDLLGCKNVRCRKRFEVAGLQSVAYMQEEATGPVADREARIRAAFGRKSSM